MSRHRHHDACAAVGVNKRRRVDGDFRIVDRVCGALPNDLLALDCLEYLDFVVEKFQLSCRFLAHDPILAVDSRLHVIDFRVDPHVCDSKERLRPERGSRQYAVA